MFSNRSVNMANVVPTIRLIEEIDISIAKGDYAVALE